MSDSEKEEQPVAKKRGRPSTVSLFSFNILIRNKVLTFKNPRLQVLLQRNALLRQRVLMSRLPRKDVVVPRARQRKNAARQKLPPLHQLPKQERPVVVADVPRKQHPKRTQPKTKKPPTMQILPIIRQDIK